MWRNNGNGTFTDATDVTGLSARPSIGAIGIDYDNDRAVDLVVTRWPFDTPVKTRKSEGGKNLSCASVAVLYADVKRRPYRAWSSQPRRMDGYRFYS